MPTVAAATAGTTAREGKWHLVVDLVGEHEPDEGDRPERTRARQSRDALGAKRPRDQRSEEQKHEEHLLHDDQDARRCAGHLGEEVAAKGRQHHQDPRPHRSKWPPLAPDPEREGVAPEDNRDRRRHGELGLRRDRRRVFCRNRSCRAKNGPKSASLSAGGWSEPVSSGRVTAARIASTPTPTATPIAVGPSCHARSHVRKPPRIAVSSARPRGLRNERSDENEERSSATMSTSLSPRRFV
jgi:hypothetical protein